MASRADSDEPTLNDVGATAVSKRLSYVLRHDPASIGARLDPAGWVGISELLSGFARDGLNLTADELLHIVETSDKQRFAIDASGRRIRANHGHSVDVDLGLLPQQPPVVLFHGTADKFVDEILLTGLLAKARQLVHLSADVETARIVGARRGKPVVLYILAGRMAANDDGDFFQTSSGVWLVDHVPPEYVSIHGMAALAAVDHDL